jgi:two-component system cell cycle sensor histidine kinase/response regulator CckA
MQAIARSVLILLLFAIPGLAAPPPKNVLLINSYHQGFGWSDQVAAAVTETLREGLPDVLISFEYLDAKRTADDAHLENLFRLFQHKYARTAFDLILLSDNDALAFAQRFGQRLFPGVPVVFCGINDYQAPMTEGIPQSTGVVETVSTARRSKRRSPCFPGPTGWC